MPIPLNELEESSLAGARSFGPRALPALGRAPSVALYPRLLAHFIDLCVLEGVSLYNAKLFSLFLLSVHARAISHSGRLARPLFLEAYDYSTSQLMAASMAAIGVLYFVALPMFTGRTLGLGLLGLRIRGENGAAPTMRQLLYRMFGCCVTYASAGLLCAMGLRNREGRFLQDTLSGTRVTRD